MIDRCGGHQWTQGLPTQYSTFNNEIPPLRPLKIIIFQSFKNEAKKRNKISAEEISRRSIDASIKADGDFINLLRQYVADQRERRIFIAVIWVIESSSKECSVLPTPVNQLRLEKKAPQSKTFQKKFSLQRPSRNWIFHDLPHHHEPDARWRLLAKIIHPIHY